MSDLYDGLRYEPSAGPYEIDDATLETDVFGLHSVKRTYGIAPALLEAHLNGLEDGQADGVLAGLGLVKRLTSSKISGPWARFTLHFKGLLENEAIPEPTAVVELEERTVTLTNSSDSITVTYMSPVTTWTYAATERPKFPRMKNKVLPIYGAEIIDIDGNPDAETEESSPTVSRSSFVTRANVFRFKRRIVQTIFRQEQEGRHWACTEKNEWRLVDANRRIPNVTVIPR